MTTKHLPNFQSHEVFGHPFLVGRLPPNLDELATARFEDIWSLHPEQSNEILIHGRMVAIPRYQQAFGRDYHFSGTVNEALPVPELLAPFLEWVCQSIDPRLNGLLLNWYDAHLHHYIGAHRDSREGLVVGSPIVTISIGAERAFRLRPFKEKGFRDFEAEHGSVFVMPWETTLAVKPEVPHQASRTGRRISITARAFSDAAIS
jgi:alkylated DNA repair dioxygenase AlkB